MFLDYRTVSVVSNAIPFIITNITTGVSEGSFAELCKLFSDEGRKFNRPRPVPVRVTDPVNRVTVNSNFSRLQINNGKEIR